MASHELQKAFEALARVVEPVLDPDDELPETDPGLGLELVLLGVELASRKKEQFRLEREVAMQERDADVIPPEEAKKRLRDASLRYISAGGDLWRYQQKKARFEDPVPFVDPRHGSVSTCLPALYRTSGGLDDNLSPKGPSSFLSDALTYYAGSKPARKSLGRAPGAWCHVIGSWCDSTWVKAAHIVPFFLYSDDIGEILFGKRAPSLRQAGNALLLSRRIKSWFDTYQLLIVPVDVNENPIARWRVDVISSDINNTATAGIDGHGPYGGDLQGKDLTFRNDKRPVPRFMYFRFVMSLIHLKDVNRRGWEEIWAKYYEQRPFPTPAKYVRQSVLRALATHFGTADTTVHIVESWMVDHGLDTPLKLSDDQATEAARLVHLAVEEAMICAEKDLEDQNSDEDSETEDEEEEEEEEEEDEAN